MNFIYFIFILISFTKSEKVQSLEELVNGTDTKLSCDNKPCIIKCCPVNYYVKGRKKCAPFEGASISNLTVYKDVDNFEKVNQSIFKLFNVIPGMFLINKKFRSDAINVIKFMNDVNIYLSEKAVLFMEVPNGYPQWDLIKNNRFCVDYTNSDENSGTIKYEPRFWVVFPEDEPEDPVRNAFLTSAMWVSAFFLFLVLVVYSLLPELRNLCGMILMAYVGSLCMAFFFLALIRVLTISREYCIHLTCCVYFSFLAAFCWMSVMSYDIWWTFRGYAKARPIHRRGETFKFIMYSIYAFGVPLAMSIFLAVVNETDMRHMPWFVTPNIPRRGCFLQGGERLLYLYCPMLILFVCNWLFYLMTAFNVWRLSRGTAVLDRGAAGTPAAHRSQKHRFLVYLKLSIVMGLNWVLEVISFLCPEYKVWWITDGYNILIGVAIFIIFVCKAKIIRKLDKRIKYLYQSSQSWHPGHSTRSNTTTSDSTSSQETQTLQICSNPKGPAYTLNNF